MDVSSWTSQGGHVNAIVSGWTFKHSCLEEEISTQSSQGGHLDMVISGLAF